MIHEQQQLQEGQEEEKTPVRQSVVQQQEGPQVPDPHPEQSQVQIQRQEPSPVRIPYGSWALASVLVSASSRAMGTTAYVKHP